jgi:hypothetical protein
VASTASRSTAVITAASRWRRRLREGLANLAPQGARQVVRILPTHMHGPFSMASGETKTCGMSQF